MRILEVIESKRWLNIRTRATASIYGSLPWTREQDKDDWIIATVGWTWRLDNGTIGLGRRPANSREEALEVMRKFNGGAA